MTTALTERRTEAATRLDTLRTERGKATLDGAEPTLLHEAIADTRAEIESIDEAEAERVRRERQLVAEQEAERVERLRAQVVGANAERLRAINDAEAAARTMVAAFKRTFAAIDQMSAAAKAIPLNLDMRLAKNEQARRLSNVLSLQLKNLSHPATFGSMGLHIGALAFTATAETPWIDVEAKDGFGESDFQPPQEKA